MSKILSPISKVFVSFVLILQFFTFASGQDVDIWIKISPENRSADVRGTLARENVRRDTRRLSFLDEYAGVKGLAERLSKVYFYTSEGYPIAHTRLAGGERVSGQEVGKFSYTVALKPFEARSAAAHVSWIDESKAILMLDDLLPQAIGKTAKVTLEMPGGWRTFTTERATAANEFYIADVEKASILVGSGWRERLVPAGASSISLLLSGTWQFGDEIAWQTVSEIFQDYKNTFGSDPRQQSQIAIFKFPHNVPHGNWEADSRGSSITIASSDMPFITQSQQRLHEQLRHEIFHLWIPNGLNLSGNYDWFYDGFALYQSLKTGVGVNRLRFDDFLDTLSRAYDIDAMQEKKLSLIDASTNRWSGSNTQVYARGMLVAFLCDLAMLDASKGKRSVPALLREVFEKHRPPNEVADGNAAVIAVLRNHRELVPIVERYILGAESLDWTVLLKAGGIEAERKDQLTKLKVTAKPTGRQKDLLDKLGYNNWRKLSGSNR